MWLLKDSCDYAGDSVSNSWVNAQNTVQGQFLNLMRSPGDTSSDLKQCLKCKKKKFAELKHNQTLEKGNVIFIAVLKYNVKSNEQFRTNQISNESNKENGGELFPVRLCIAVSFADLINVLICIKYVRLNMKHAEKSSPSELQPAETEALQISAVGDLNIDFNFHFQLALKAF